MFKSSSPHVLDKSVDVWLTDAEAWLSTIGYFIAKVETMKLTVQRGQHRVGYRGLSCWHPETCPGIYGLSRSLKWIMDNSDCDVLISFLLSMMWIVKTYSILFSSKDEIITYILNERVKNKRWKKRHSKRKLWIEWAYERN